jgi:hypothetical protein
MTPNHQDDRQSKGTLEELSETLEGVLRLLLALGAVGILAGAVAIIATIDGGSKSQGGRYFVAIGALVALGWIDSRFAALEWRRYSLMTCYWPRYRRYRILSLSLMLFAGVFLIGLAFLLQ